MSEGTTGPVGRDADAPSPVAPPNEPLTSPPAPPPAGSTTAPPPVAPDWVGEWSDAGTGWAAPSAADPRDTAPTLITPAATAQWTGAPTAVDPSAPSPGPGVTGFPPPAFAPPQVPPTRYAGVPAYAAPMPGLGGWGAVRIAPKPGVVPLRPLGLGEILDGAVTYIRRDPKTVLGISALIALASTAISFGLSLLSLAPLASLDLNDPGSDATMGQVNTNASSVVSALVSLPIGVLATGLLTAVMGQSVLGRRVTMSEAWRRTRPRFWRLLGLTLLIMVAVGAILGGGIALAIGIGVVLDQGGAGGLGILLGLIVGLAAVVAAIWVYVRWMLSPAVVILEGSTIRTGLSRSRSLVTGAWWRTFGIMLLGRVISSVISGILVVPFALVGGVLLVLAGADSAGRSLILLVALTSLGTLIAQTIVVPFEAGIVSLLYIDRRIRREALDIELARAAGVGP